MLRHQDWDFFIRFGEIFSWDYNPNTFAIVIWEKGAKRTIDFPSCVNVYKNYKYSINNTLNQKKYLFGMYEKSLQYNAEKKVKDFYLKELKTLNYRPTSKRESLMITFPLFYQIIRKIIKSKK